MSQKIHITKKHKENNMTNFTKNTALDSFIAGSMVSCAEIADFQRNVANAHGFLQNVQVSNEISEDPTIMRAYLISISQTKRSGKLKMELNSIDQLLLRNSGQILKPEKATDFLPLAKSLLSRRRKPPTDRKSTRLNSSHA